MICVVAVIETRPGMREEFLSVLDSIVPQVRAEAGCIEYAPMIDAATPLGNEVNADVVTIVEKWESVEALQAHLASPHMQTYKEKSAPFRRGMQLRVLREP